MIQPERVALDLAEIFTGAAPVAAEKLRIRFGKDRCQRQATDPAEQAQGEGLFGYESARFSGQMPRRHRAGERFGPEDLVIECFTSAVAMVINERKPQSQVLHRSQAKEFDRDVQRSDSARHACKGGVDQLQEACGQGGVGFGDAGDLCQCGVIITRQAQNLEGHPGGRGEARSCPEVAHTPESWRFPPMPLSELAFVPVRSRADFCPAPLKNRLL